jgi:hypothetical protein
MQVPESSKTIFNCFGNLDLPIRVAQCRVCGARYSTLLSALEVSPYVHKEANLEQQVIEAVIDTNYRRLIERHSIDISLGGVHNVVVGSDIDRQDEVPIELDHFSAIMANGTVVKQQKGQKR